MIRSAAAILLASVALAGTGAKPVQTVRFCRLNHCHYPRATFHRAGHRPFLRDRHLIARRLACLRPYLIAHFAILHYLFQHDLRDQRYLKDDPSH